MVFSRKKYNAIEDVDPEEVFSATCHLLDWPDEKLLIFNIRGKDYKPLFYRAESASLKECFSMMEEFTKKVTELLGLVMVWKSANGYTIEFAPPDVAKEIVITVNSSST